MRAKKAEREEKEKKVIICYPLVNITPTDHRKK